MAATSSSSLLACVLDLILVDSSIDDAAMKTKNFLLMEISKKIYRDTYN
jgi:hypothetical protein